jgi:hypothetical protein
VPASPLLAARTRKNHQTEPQEAHKKSQEASQSHHPDTSATPDRREKGKQDADRVGKGKVPIRYAPSSKLPNG